MSKMPLVSVIIPVFNCEKYIGRCIRSILNQSLARDNYEIIVVNDASTDNTAFALNLFLDEIRLINNEKQLGLAGTLNVGIRKAHGKYIVRLDADDYVHREYLNILSLFLDLNNDIDATACDYLLVDDHENIIESKNCMESPIGCGIMFRIEQLIDVGLYDAQFKSREDEDLQIRFLKKYGINRVQLPLYRYRRHDSNMTNDQERMDKFKELLNQKHNTPKK